MSSENKMLTINDVQKDALKAMSRMLFEDKSSAQIKDMLGIMALTALDAIITKRYAEGPYQHAEIGAEIVNSIEFWFRDFVNYELQELYGPDEEEKNVSAD